MNLHLMLHNLKSASINKSYPYDALVCASQVILSLDDVKKSSILKNGIGIEGQKSTQTSKKYVCRQIKMVLKCC